MGQIKTARAFFVLNILCTFAISAQDLKDPAVVKTITIPSTRDAKESWRILADRFLKPLEPAPVQPVEPEVVKTAFDSKVPGAQLAATYVPSVKSEEELKKYFEYARGTRHLKDPNPLYETFLRRIPWLFPDDGCFLRASLVSKLLQKDFQQATGRAFVFGDLWVDSPQSPQRIHWWYHTAATLKLNNTTYVIDVAIDAKKILTLQDWVNKQNVKFETAEVSLCDSDTYFPNQLCKNSGPDDDMSPDHTKQYLNAERTRQQTLHSTENPAVVDNILGESPPWLER